MNKIILEVFCDECDEVIHALCDGDEFNSFKVGRIQCPKCGEISRPCNECWNPDTRNHHSCSDCPYLDSKCIEPITDEAYVKWMKENQARTFEEMLDGTLGEIYQNIAKSLNND